MSSQEYNRSPQRQPQRQFVDHPGRNLEQRREMHESDPYSHLGGEQGREPYRATNADHATYLGGPGSGSYGYGAGGHGYSGPEDRGMNREPHGGSGHGNFFSAGYNQQAHHGEIQRPGFSFEPHQADPYPHEHGPFAGRGPRGYRRSDERICDDVCERLTRHGAIDATEIEVSAHEGEVTLKGTVSDRQSKRLAEELAESVFGVRDVHNQVRVRKPEEQQAQK